MAFTRLGMSAQRSTAARSCDLGCKAIVHQTEAEREWAHDRASHVGRLDKAWDEAMVLGKTVVSM